MSETTVLFVAWVAAALVLVLLGTRVGPRETRPWNLVLSGGSPKRVSLTNLQLTLWTIVVLSLLTGLFVARLVDSPATALEFAIPPELLLVMGISATSTVLSATVPRRPDAGAAANSSAPPRLMDAVTTSTDAGDQLEVTRFQNFWLTIIVVVAYVALAAATFADTDNTKRFDSLPPLSGEIVTLLAISHGGYLAKKTVDHNRDNGNGGTPPGGTPPGGTPPGGVMPGGTPPGGATPGP
ncbi:MAG TPA: hypothetical protein VHN37_13445 [Actinomycetota bacterium]|nr:hypothetical protein [Actinomycetota bacterium]